MVVSSSGQYSFLTVSVETIIREAFEIVGIPASSISAEQLEGSVRSLNFLISDLVNRNINLWTLKQMFLTLQEGKTKYALPPTLFKLIQADLRSSTRELTGSAFSSSGTPENAFNGNPKTACILTDTNGNIGFKFDYPQNITFLGINSSFLATYKLVFEASNDNATYEPLLTIETPAQFNDIAWFDVLNVNKYTYYRIIETGGAILNITELYFNDRVVDTPLAEISNYDYLRMPIKNNLGRPTIYSLDYQIIPVLNLWQAPQKQYNCILLNYQSLIESIVGYTESINIPNYFYTAFVYGLAKALSIKYVPEKLEIVANEFETILDRSIIKNTSTLPLRFNVYGN